MPKETVIVGCRLPNGVILTHPQKPFMQVKINGCHGEKLESGLTLPPKPYATTEVDAEFWEAWKLAYAGYPPLKTRAIFEAKNENEASAKAKDLQSVKTGFEQMSPNAVIDGVRMEKAAA